MTQTLFSLRWPATTLNLFKVLGELVSFGVIPVTDAVQYVFQFEETPPFNEQWETMGVETGNMIVNLGFFFLILAFCYCMTALASFMGYVCRCRNLRPKL